MSGAQIKRRRLQMNEQRRKLLKGIAQGLNVSEAGRRAGYTRAQAAHKAFNVIKMNAPEIMEKIGLPAENLLKIHFLPLLKAVKIQYFAYKGVVMDVRVTADNDIRLRTADSLASMLGLYPRGAKREASESPSDELAPITINIGVADPAEAKRIAQAVSVRRTDLDQPGVDTPVDADEARTIASGRDPQCGEVPDDDD